MFVFALHGMESWLSMRGNAYGGGGVCKNKIYIYVHPVEVTLFCSSEFLGHVSTGAELTLPPPCPPTPTPPQSPAEFKQKKAAI